MYYKVSVLNIHGYIPKWLNYKSVIPILNKCNDC